MHKILGKFFRYVLWFLLLAILFLLFIGLWKQNWDVKEYVQSLNERSRSQAWEDGGLAGVFWGEATNSLQLITNSGNVQPETGIEELSTGMNVYNPSFEEDLNAATQDDLGSGDYVDVQTDFGFVTDDGSGTDDSMSNTSTGTKSQQLLDLINSEK